MIYGFTFRTSGERSIAASIVRIFRLAGRGLLISQPGETYLNPAPKRTEYMRVPRKYALKV